MKKFTIAEHTADIRIELLSDSLQGLFEAGAEGLYSVAGEMILDKKEKLLRLSVQGGSDEELLVKFLNEILFLFYNDKLKIAGKKIIKFEKAGELLKFQAKFVNIKSFKPFVEIKAVTYGDLKVEMKDNIYKATVIADV